MLTALPLKVATAAEIRLNAKINADCNSGSEVGGTLNHDCYDELRESMFFIHTYHPCVCV